MSLGNLKQILRAVAEEQDISNETLETVRFSSEDPIISEVANDAWIRLRHFVNDDDVRAKDQDYERSFRIEFRYRLEEIEALERGDDPYRRRVSRWEKWGKRFGSIWGSRD
jgi:hypothetical protein